MPDVLLGAGEHTIYLSGTLHAPGNGSFGGDINIGGVPEPATWAMMLLGIRGNRCWYAPTPFAGRTRARVDN